MAFIGERSHTKITSSFYLSFIPYRLSVEQRFAFLLSSRYYPQWEDSWVPTGKGVAFPVGKVLSSQWERCCFLIGKGIAFLLSKAARLHWNTKNLSNGFQFYLGSIDSFCHISPQLEIYEHKKSAEPRRVRHFKSMIIITMKIILNCTEKVY